MTLTTHAVVGAAAASLFPTMPVLAFAAGFASHFAIDALPHWDYKILSKVEGNTKLEGNIDTRNPLFLLDLMRIGSDAAIGTLIAVFIFSFWLFDLPIWFAVMGAWAGILPDPLQFVYYKTRLKRMEPLQRFHIWIQKGKSIYPHAYVGLFYQFVLIAAVIGCLRLI